MFQILRNMLITRILQYYTYTRKNKEIMKKQKTNRNILHEQIVEQYGFFTIRN